MKSEWIIGIMSGTSLDGVDLALCRFQEQNGSYTYEIAATQTYAYPEIWIQKIQSAYHCDSEQLVKLDREYGTYLGKLVLQFLKEFNITNPIRCIASHGHTIFHQPEKGYTFQMGHGASLLAACSIPVVCDFRSLDVALGGQGAPLVPVGDALLFAEYSSCLNLGGFANISYTQNNSRLAFDVCPCNLVLNALAQKLGKPYDDQGRIAATGTVHQPLLQQLNAHPYFFKSGSKSLGREWVETEVNPILELYPELSVADALATYTQHVAYQIHQVVKKQQSQPVLITGGGAYNKTLISMLEQTGTAMYLPDEQTIQFKEALVFAFLGWLRWHNKINVWASVTGAKRDSSCGIIFY